LNGITNHVLSYNQILGHYKHWSRYDTIHSLSLSELVGTSHDGYSKLIDQESITWIEWLGALKKFYRNFYLMSRGKEAISSIIGGSLVSGYNKKFFVADNGNNRLVLLKFLGVQHVELDQISLFKDI